MSKDDRSCLPSFHKLSSPEPSVDVALLNLTHFEGNVVITTEKDSDLVEEEIPYVDEENIHVEWSDNTSDIHKRAFAIILNLSFPEGPDINRNLDEDGSIVFPTNNSYEYITSQFPIDYYPAEFYTSEQWYECFNNIQNFTVKFTQEKIHEHNVVEEITTLSFKFAN